MKINFYKIEFNIVTSPFAWTTKLYTPLWNRGPEFQLIIRMLFPRKKTNHFKL